MHTCTYTHAHIHIHLHTYIRMRLQLCLVSLFLFCLSLFLSRGLVPRTRVCSILSRPAFIFPRREPCSFDFLSFQRMTLFFQRHFQSLCFRYFVFFYRDYIFRAITFNVSFVHCCNNLNAFHFRFQSFNYD